jgi:ABC-type antimicrobial peptide transport system permease subunit
MTALIFGLVNTLVTSVMERVHELGMLRAVGMRPGAVVMQVVIESTFIMMIGVALGLTLGWLIFQLLPPVLDLSSFSEGFEKFGMPAKIHLRLHVSDMVLITVMSMVFGVLASLYPAKRAVKISPLEALRL